MVHLAGKLAQDTSGAAAVLLALSAPALVGVSAMAVDLGSLYLAERELQGVADAAAAAAVGGDIAADAESAASATIAANGVPDTVLHSLETGLYSRDGSIALDDRFETGSTTPNAVRISLTREVPLFFGSFLLGKASSRVAASATAARMDMMSFEIGSKLISIGGGLPNKILSQLAGTELSLSDEQIADLAAGTIDVIAFADALRVIQGTPAATFGQAFDATTQLHLAIKAMAATTEDQATRAVLLQIADAIGASEVVVSDVIDLGPYHDIDVDDGRTHVEVDVYSMLRTLLETSRGDGYELAFDLNVAGLTSTRIRAVGGRGVERSPWLTLTSAYDVVLRTAQTRLYAELGLSTTLSALGAVKLPIYTELAAAEARVTDVDCQAPKPDQFATLGVTPSVGEVALAEINDAAFSDLSQEMWLYPAEMVSTAQVKVTGYGDLALGGDTQEDVRFSREEIDARARKDVGTKDLATAALSSLLSETDFTVTTGGLSLGLGSTVINNALSASLIAAAPAIDRLLVQVTESLGVRLGVAEVAVTNLRCGRPTIVA